MQNYTNLNRIIIVVAGAVYAKCILVEQMEIEFLFENE